MLTHFSGLYSDFLAAVAILLHAPTRLHERPQSHVHSPRLVRLLLVPKFHLGTHVLAKLHFVKQSRDPRPPRKSPEFSSCNFPPRHQRPLFMNPTNSIQTKSPRLQTPPGSAGFQPALSGILPERKGEMDAVPKSRLAGCQPVRAGSPRSPGVFANGGFLFGWQLLGS